LSGSIYFQSREVNLNFLIYKVSVLFSNLESIEEKVPQLQEFIAEEKDVIK